MDLLIVESTAKARTLEKYLGGECLVRACRGHVQDLPVTGKEGGKAWWTNQPGQLPNPPWEWTEDSEELLSEMVDEAEGHGVERFFVGSDPDREGEFIAWRLAAILERKEVYRVTFQEITEEAVREALSNPREIDMDLVDSAKVRRFMDRLVGYRGSKFAKSWVSGTVSMGRVQTPTLGFVVDRELEREAFVPIPYFRVLAAAEGIAYSVRFHEKDDAGRWTNDDGRFYPDRTGDRELARNALAALEEAGRVTVTSTEPGTYSRNPASPFTTETLLGAAGSEFAWNPGRTMAVASELYNAGHVTYIRTDSTRTGGAPRRQVQELIAERWGEDHLGPGAQDAAPGGLVQDAHEAVRPTRPHVLVPEGLEADEQRLYHLIWARFAASQMSPSKYRKLELAARVGEGGQADFDRLLQATVRWRVHAGWEAAYEDLREAGPEAPPSASLEVGAVHELDPAAADEANPRLIEDTTKPPARYRQHTLIREMKQEGIGRPSTYASTVQRLLDRGYCIEEDRELVPTEKGRKLWLHVVPFYDAGDSTGSNTEARTDGEITVGADTNVFSSGFTAEMESVLDTIEGGQGDAPAAWETFRDQFRARHQVALKRKKERATPRAMALARQLLSGLDENERHGMLQGLSPDNLENLSGPEISRLIERLLEATGGVLPPSEKQLQFIEKLIGEVGMSEGEAAGLVGAEDVSKLTGGKEGTASVLIDELASLQPASEKQVEFARSLATELGLGEEEACGLVGAESFSELTGGKDGTGSQLIDRLKELEESETP